MVQRSRVAPVSEVRSLRAGGKPRARRVEAFLRNGTLLVLIAALVFVLPKFVGPGFLHDQARGAMGFAAVAGQWARDALVAAFQSVPVR